MEVGNGLSAGANDLVLESAPQMAQELAKDLALEKSALAVAKDDATLPASLENPGAGIADGVGTGTHPNPPIHAILVSRNQRTHFSPN